MTTITAVDLEVADAEEAGSFYANAFDLDGQVGLRPVSDEPSQGFRFFTLSLVVAQPSTVDSLVGTAVEAGATAVKPVSKSFWGYGGVVQAPDGSFWKVASSSKKDTGPQTREVDDIVLLLGVADVKATKQFYVDQGFQVGKSYGSKYVEFEAPSGIKLALYGRPALAKDAGVPNEGSGSHRIVVRNDTATFTDPDGFVWEHA